MGVDLKRFVDIKIKPHIQSQAVGTRDTIAVLTSYDTAATTVASYSEAATAFTGMTNLLACLKVYFDNDGVKAYVVGNVTTTGTSLADAVTALDNKYICVTYVGNSYPAEPTYTAVRNVATTRAADATIYGINEKIILASSSVNTDTASVKNFAVKYSSTTGAEMLMAAYLSKINVYGIDTVYDYMFTSETFTAMNVTDTQYATCMTNNYNVDITLANAVRNCGGNCKDGVDLVNNFCRIVLHQTLTEQLINLLAQKIKNESGISKIYAVLSQELEKYLTCGYLTTDKIWTDNDLTVTYNGAQYTIIEKGTALENGYLIKILPYSSLSAADQAAHKAPPIYVVIADQYGIRSITINGEVI